MTMHADQLVGAPVTDSDGLAVGTVEQVFRDDVAGTPSWARIRSAKGLHFVPLAGSKMTSGGGLSVPFDSGKILDEPDMKVDRHMSVDQEEQLRQYFGINVPAPRKQPTQATQPTQVPQPPQPPQTQDRPETQAGRADAGQAEAGRAEAGRTQAGRAEAGHGDAGSEWLIRSEERLAVNLEARESGRVTLHKVIDTEPVQQTVRIFHEEYEVERIPVSEDDQVGGDLAERDQQIILHEARANISKETIPVERVRLSVRKVEEDQIVNGEIRKERIEIEASGTGESKAGGPPGKPGG